MIIPIVTHKILKTSGGKQLNIYSLFCHVCMNKSRHANDLAARIDGHVFPYCI
jgi:hypothetical protein